MSIDFDSAALQTQHDEEEYDQEDYAREQELQKLLTDLPDDMLEDSRDSSSPELEYSTCSNKNTGNSPQSMWTQQWSVHPRQTSHEQNYEVDYDQRSHDEYTYEDGAAQINGHGSHPQSQPLPHTWNQQSQDHQFTQGDYTYTSIGTEKSTETNDFSTDDYESKAYPQGTNNAVMYNGEGGRRDNQNYGDHNNGRNHFQELQSGPGERVVDQYKASYNPHHPAHQPKMFNSQAAHQEGQLDHLQRQFLDSTQQTADREQLAQLQILKKAQQRQIEDLERKLEDSRRNMRYIEHQFAIVKDEKDGLAVSLKESSQLVEEAKEREVQMQNKLKAMEQQVKVLTERNQENMKKQMVADAAVDSMKQQMLELCRSDTLSRAREQHDRDFAVIKEQHDTALLTVQQKLDATSQALNEQIDVGQRLREQVKQLERQREEDQLERARVVNALTQRLEESQQQCAKLLQTGSVQEMTQVQIKLQQAQSAKALSENMNKVLQEDLADLKEQITLYESAVKHGVIALDLNSDWENQLSESCMDLGLKKTNRKNGLLHSTALAHLSESKLPKDEALQLLRVEMQRCLGSLKGKRQKISQLQEEVQLCQSRVNELQTQLDEAKLSSSVRETSQMKHLDVTGESHKEFMRLQEDKRHLQEQVEVLEKKNKELKQSEEKVRSANSELCIKMREMIQELDQEKQEASERTERIHQQYRDDVVHQIRTELMLEHDAQVEQLTAQHQQQVQQLETQLSEANDKMLAVQECYISVCKEKDMLEERTRNWEKAEALIREDEQNMKEETGAAVEKLRAELEAQHQASVNQLKALWSKEKETEIQVQVTSHVTLAKAAWKEELQKMEKTWVQRLEEARREKQRETAEATCQAGDIEASSVTITVEDLDSRLSAQKQQLQLDADKVKRKAVEEAKKQTQRVLHEKHLEDMAKQVEGAVTRAYNRWIEDLTSLPEYQASLQTEREKWEELQEKQVSQALREAEEQWHKKQTNQLEEKSTGTQQVEELQEEVAALQTRLEQVRREQAALLKAELAGARAAWNRDKQQEISAIQVRTEQVYQTKLQEQCKKLEQALQQAREDADLQKKELLLQMEAKLQHTLGAREEQWRCQHAEKEKAQRQQMRDELLAELQTGLAEVQAQLLRDPKTDQRGTEDIRRTSGATSEGTITHIIQTSCKDIVNRAVSQAKKEWKKISEEKLTHVLKETQQQHVKEINKVQNSLSQGKEQVETVSKLQKKNQELQRHLEKACRQLQHSVRKHKTAMQHLKDEHESSLQKTKEEHLQQLEEVKRAKESSGSSDHQHSLQQGLEEMKQQYLITVEKIRGDMLRYLQESRERAAEMIRTEVQRERQDTARKMRRYYLTCLQELLEDGGKTTGAEKKIMNAASKLAAMAKVLETPIKSKSGKNYSLQSDCPPGTHAGFSNIQSTLPELPDIRPEERSHRAKTSADTEQKQTASARTKPLSHQDISASGKEESSIDAGLKLLTAAHTHLRSYKPSQQMASPSQVDFVSVSVRTKSRELCLQGVDSSKADNRLDSERQNKPFLIQEAPVRDEKRTDWSMTSGDSDTGFQVSRLSYSGRKVEPVKPFSVSAASASDLGEFGGLTPDVSDVTVYNEIAKKTPHIQTLNRAKMSAHREPTPGSEAERQHGVRPGPLFSELRQRQQDSGFDSPFYQQK